VKDEEDQVQRREIVGILKEIEAGVTVSEICRKYGISDDTYYN
jgi:DNA invertase Pin-like site-specific DNA recombinase